MRISAEPSANIVISTVTANKFGTRKEQTQRFAVRAAAAPDRLRLVRCVAVLLLEGRRTAFATRRRLVRQQIAELIRVAADAQNIGADLKTMR